MKTHRLCVVTADTNVFTFWSSILFSKFSQFEKTLFRYLFRSGGTFFFHITDGWNLPASIFYFGHPGRFFSHKQPQIFMYLKGRIQFFIFFIALPPFCKYLYILFWWIERSWRSFTTFKWPKSIKFKTKTKTSLVYFPEDWSSYKDWN